MRHRTINGVRVAIDVDGYVRIPDADGNADQLEIGRVAQTGDEREWGMERPDGSVSARRTQGEAIADLLAIFNA